MIRWRKMWGAVEAPKAENVFNWNASLCISTDFLLKIPEQVIVEKIDDGDLQSVTNFFNGGYGGALVTAADNIVQSWLSDTTDCRKFIDSNISLITHDKNAQPDRSPNAHGITPLELSDIKACREINRLYPHLLQKKINLYLKCIGVKPL